MLSLDGPRPLGAIHASAELLRATMALVTAPPQLLLAPASSFAPTDGSVAPKDGAAADDDDGESDARHEAIVAALRAAAFARAEEEQLDYLASMLVEYARDARPDSAAAWCVVLSELIADADLPIGEVGSVFGCGCDALRFLGRGWRAATTRCIRGRPPFLTSEDIHPVACEAAPTARRGAPRTITTWVSWVAALHHKESLSPRAPRDGR